MPVARPELQLTGQGLDGTEDQTIYDFHCALCPRTVSGRKVVMGSSGFLGLVNYFIVDMRAAVGDPGMNIPEGRKPNEEAAGSRDVVTGLAWPESYKTTHIVLDDEDFLPPLAAVGMESQSKWISS